MKPRRTILVSGMIAADPCQGGATWAVLQYVLGLQRLGCEVILVEPIPTTRLQPAGADLAHSRNAVYFRQVMRAFGIEDHAALLATGSRETVGLPFASLQRAARRADLLINISGMLTDETLTGSIPLRVYLDLDPVFNQLWHAAEGIDMRFAGHTHFVTVGLALGEPGCAVPTCGLPWLKTLQPVVLDHWPVGDTITHDGLTSVGNWRGYGSIEHEGVLYGQRVHSFRRFLSLPSRAGERLMPALAIHPDEIPDIEALSTHGWTVLDPRRVADTPETYRSFIRGSKGELGIAKSGYVVSRSGWFSDRSVCYLASGRPVIAQDTGFTAFLPTGEGLFPFSDADGVLAAIDTMNTDYPLQSRRARAMAEAYFNSDTVLRKLLDQVGVS